MPTGAEVVTAYTNGRVTLRRNVRAEGYHEAADLSGFQGVEVGDFVVHGLDILRGSVGVSDSSGAISSVCIVCAPREPVDLRFFAYVMQAQAFSGFPRAMARGIREGGADFRRWDTLGDLPLPLPEKASQSAIANYLDAETERVDGLVSARRQFMALLDEWRRARITRIAATGDSVRVKFLVSLTTSGPRGWGDLAGDVGRPFVRSANLRRESIEINDEDLARVDPPQSDESVRSRIQSGDVLVAITGANTGWIGLARDAHAGGYVSQHVAILRPSGIVSEWLAYCLAADPAQRRLLGTQYGGTKTQLGLEDLRELPIQVPSLGEQRLRVARLRRTEDAVLAAKQAAARQIDLMLERRQALITAAVTGELEIPGVAA